MILSAAFGSLDHASPDKGAALRRSGVRSKAGPIWADVSGETLSARIVRQVREALFANKLTPGTRLGTEASMAGEFGVSRMAMRDSLRSLAAAGILEIRVGLHGGVFVAQGNPERLTETLAIQLKLIGVDIAEVLDAQIAIEVMAAGLAARNASDADIGALKQGLDGLLELVDEPEPFTRASLEFREQVLLLSCNRVLIAQFRALRHVLMPLYTSRTTPEVAQRAVAAHRALIAAIEARDPVAARDIMQRRLEVIRSRHLMRAQTG